MGRDIGRRGGTSVDGDGEDQKTGERYQKTEGIELNNFRRNFSSRVRCRLMASEEGERQLPIETFAARRSRMFESYKGKNSCTDPPRLSEETY